MDTNDVIASINGLITLACLIIQVVGIRKGRYDSSLAAWIIWTAIFSFLFVIYITEHGLTTFVYLLAAQTVGHIGMIFVTYKYSHKGFTDKEKRMINISIGAFIIWVISKSISWAFDIDILIPIIIGTVGQIVADAMGANEYFKLIKIAPFRQPLSAWILNMFIYPLTVYGTMLANSSNTIVANYSNTEYIFLGYAWIVYWGIVVKIILERSRQKRLQTG